MMDEEIEDMANEKEVLKPQKDENQSSTSTDVNENIPKSFLKGFKFENCTVNFQLPGPSPK